MSVFSLSWIGRKRVPGGQRCVRVRAQVWFGFDLIRQGECSNNYRMTPCGGFGLPRIQLLSLRSGALSSVSVYCVVSIVGFFEEDMFTRTSMFAVISVGPLRFASLFVHAMWHHGMSLCSVHSASQCLLVFVSRQGLRKPRPPRGIVISASRFVKN